MQQELEPTSPGEKPEFEGEPSEQPEIDLEELRSKWKEARQRDSLGTNEKVAEFANHLLKKYSDCQGRALYHLLVGSTPMNEADASNLEDFEGDDSIVNFINSL